ncbi:MAG: hypothetical protein DRH12_18385, partial [Deltaproteobacteria bacterium]
MSEKLPIISGKQLINSLTSLGYNVVRQRGSHVRMEKKTSAGTHKITLHFVLSPRTFILGPLSVSLAPP